VFVNVKDGNAFFDCSPAEARMASKLIKEMRDAGESNIDFIVRFKTDIGAVVKSAIVVPRDDEWTVGGFSVPIIMNGFKALEGRDVRVTHVIMNAQEYASVRLFDRDCMEAMTEAWKLRAGVMAVMWGAFLVVTKDIPKGSVVFCAMEGDTSEFFRIDLKYDKDSDYGRPTKTVSPDVMNDKLDKILEMLGESS